MHYGPHTWPVWGNDERGAFLESQRDTYKYIHDQALRLANKGYTPLEAAEVIELPDELGRKWFNRGYHGTLHHDVRAVFTKELGMWDGDPVSLHPHTAGRVGEAVRRPRSAPTRSSPRAGARSTPPTTGGPRRSCTSSSSPSPTTRRRENLQADAYEQMGYQTEGPQWRDIFLTAAQELREGVAAERRSHGQPRHDPGHADRHPVRLRRRPRRSARKAADVDLRIDFDFTDLGRDLDDVGPARRAQRPPRRVGRHRSSPSPDRRRR